MEFVEISQGMAKQWDEVVLASPDGWAFATRGWLNSMASVWNLEEHSFAVRQNGELLGVMPLQSIPGEKRLSSGGWGHGGAILVPGLAPKQHRRVSRAMYGRMLEVADQIGAHLVTASLSPLSTTSLESPRSVNPLIDHGFTDISTQSRIVEFTSDEDSLWMTLSQDSRQQVKKAREAGYRVQRRQWPEMLEAYYEVHVENYTRTGITPHPKAHFQVLGEIPGHRAVLWVAYGPDGEPVAFHNDARFGNKSMYHTGCSSSEHLRSGVNYLLMWESLLGALRDGCRWYEVGELFPNAASGKAKGLTIFKSKFGGEIHRVFRGEIALEQPAESEPREPNWQHMTKAELAHHWNTLTLTVLKRAINKVFDLYPRKH